MPGFPAGKVFVDIAVADPPPTLSAGKGMGALRPAPGLPKGAGLHHLVLARSRTEWRSEIEPRWREVPGGICARLARVTLRLA
jgi:hypothetical protein